MIRLACSTTAPSLHSTPTTQYDQFLSNREEGDFRAVARGEKDVQVGKGLADCHPSWLPEITTAGEVSSTAQQCHKKNNDDDKNNGLVLHLGPPRRYTTSAGTIDLRSFCDVRRNAVRNHIEETRMKFVSIISKFTHHLPPPLYTLCTRSPLLSRPLLLSCRRLKRWTRILDSAAG